MIEKRLLRKYKTFFEEGNEIIFQERECFFSCPTLYKALMGATQGCSIEWQKPVTKTFL